MILHLYFIRWVAANQKYILGAVGVIAVVILGYLGFQKFIQEPKEEEAAPQILERCHHRKEETFLQILPL